MSNGTVHASCIYNSKYNVATYRKKAPNLSNRGKVDFIKNVFAPEKKFRFQKQCNLLNMSDCCYFPEYVTLPVRMHLTACFVFCLLMIFLSKLLGLKIYFHSLSGVDQVLFLTVQFIVNTKAEN